MSEPINYPRFLIAGETAIVVEFGDSVDTVLNHRVHLLDACLATNPPHGLIETVPTYRSLLVRYDPALTSFDIIKNTINDILNTCASTGQPHEKRLVTIPVQYGGAFGPDLSHVAAHTGITEQQVIELHTAGEYTVAMLGFAPGFCYLMGLPEQLATPRLDTPRLHVPPGSVGIAGPQTGVYALETPGGWQIIGRTAIVLFDPASDTPFKLRAGDQVRFVASKDAP